MSYDYSENIFIQESVGNLLRDELAGKALVAGSTQFSVTKADKERNW